MVNQSFKNIAIGIAWCLAWGDRRDPQFDITILQRMREALLNQELNNVPQEVQQIVQQVQQLQSIPEDYFPLTLKQLKNDYGELWNQNTEIGLIYGGATKIKQYVFEAAKLPDIRGASALLDRLNLVDIPGFFKEYETNPRSLTVEGWLNKEFPGLSEALIPELLIYYKGGNILAFCPAAFVNDVANAIEKRYTEETLTANSCAVGDTFKLLELRFGLLKDNIETTPWLEWYQRNANHDLVEAYFGKPKSKAEQVECFKNRKSFNELAGKLAARFNQRRNGNDLDNRRSSRCYPPMFETHPYLIRDESDRRSAIIKAEELPGKPYLSEALTRKRWIGQIAKRDYSSNWYSNTRLDWSPREIAVTSWIQKFEDYLAQNQNQQLRSRYYGFRENVGEAYNLREIGNVSKAQGFVAYIYADGNNMGGYIQKKIRTPADYQKFSEDIFRATSEAVYFALAQHLEPREISDMTDPDSVGRNGQWIHPFEIITIGGDDVMLIVPADRALAIAQTIGEKFEELLSQNQEYQLKETSLIHKSLDCHRYQGETAKPSTCQLSISTGVLIAAEDMPIYYAQKLTEQLLKSAKKSAKHLKQEKGYHGGTVDFLVMKSVTMISSNIAAFRKEALTKPGTGNHQLKLYAAPYTLHELGGLLKTAQVLKDSEFPRSQLYQLRSLLERGKNTAMLNYRYFRVRLNRGQQELKQFFEEAWCRAKTNDGNIAPWMFVEPLKDKPEARSTYETIWRELVDLYPFVQETLPEESATISIQEPQP
ncbi:MAG: type III-B CRISPR-associated protein Cas10/Cmr2 [Desertifilum sp.]|nr:type III-B CRISPR-associated protein Cas10/Cmr2 [Desertifilum sp.]